MQKLPLGVIILAVLAFMAGIINIIGGFRLMGVVTFGPLESGNGVWLSGLLTLIVGLIYWSVGGALISLKPWALMFCQIIAIFGLVAAMFTMFSDFQAGLTQAILPGFVFWYSNRENVVSAFMNSGSK